MLFFFLNHNNHKYETYAVENQIEWGNTQSLRENYRDWVQAMVAYKTSKQNTHKKKTNRYPESNYFKDIYIFLCSNFRYADCTFNV